MSDLEKRLVLHTLTSGVRHYNQFQFRSIEDDPKTKEIIDIIERHEANGYIKSYMRGVTTYYCDITPKGWNYYIFKSGVIEIDI